MSGERLFSAKGGIFDNYQGYYVMARCIPYYIFL